MVWPAAGQEENVEIGAHGSGRFSASFEEGLRYQSEDNRVHVRFGGLFDADVVVYDERNTRASQVRLDRALVRIDGLLSERISFRADLDLRGTDTRHGFDQAWISYLSSPALRFSVGLLEVPLTVEHSIPEEDLSFVGYSFPNFQTSSQEFRTFTGGLNWYPTPNLRFTVEIVRTIADQFPGVFDSHGRDTSFVFRSQIEF